MAPDEESFSSLSELDAMRTMAEILEGLEAEARRRVLVWVGDRYGRHSALAAGIRGSQQPSPTTAPGDVLNFEDYKSLPEFFSAVQPIDSPMQALTVAVWQQSVDGEESIDPQKVNTALKHMGYGIANITKAFGSLKNRTPQFVVQTKKSGSTKQARKRFKVTTEGINEIQRLLSAAH